MKHITRKCKSMSRMIFGLIDNWIVISCWFSSYRIIEDRKKAEEEKAMSEMSKLMQVHFELSQYVVYRMLVVCYLQYEIIY